jgi:hypothetical protein
VKLPRAPGAREARWTHLLSGAVDVERDAGGHRCRRVRRGERDCRSEGAAATRCAPRVDELRGLVERLCGELGVSRILTSRDCRDAIRPAEHKKLTLEMTIPIRWGDMDAMGHVNNTLYFRYMEMCGWNGSTASARRRTNRAMAR